MSLAATVATLAKRASAEHRLKWPMKVPRSAEPRAALEVAPITASLSVGGSNLRAMGVPMSDPGLLGRGPWDSWLQVTYPFTTCESLRASYMLSDGVHIRWGRLFEAFDALSGDVAYRHARGGYSESSDGAAPLVIVTAAHDGLDSAKLDMQRDLRLRSYPTGVSKSAMEVRTDIAQLTPDGQVQEMGQVFTVMVARELDASGNMRAARLPPLLCGDDNQAQHRADQAERNQGRRRALGKTALMQLHTPPSPEEVPVVHRRCSGHLGPNDVTISSTRVSSSQIMQMNHRNIHGKMFGGYLMRKAFELAYICAGRFDRDSKPHFVGFDDVFFRRPVNVGDVWTYTAEVCFAAEDSLRVRVAAHVERMQDGSEEATNEFFFVFRRSEAHKHISVVPETYKEAMTWLEGRRRWIDSHDQ